jgi:hypothetical protein
MHIEGVKRECGVRKPPPPPPPSKIKNVCIKIQKKMHVGPGSNFFQNALTIKKSEPACLMEFQLHLFARLVNKESNTNKAKKTASQVRRIRKIISGTNLIKLS